MRLLLMILAAFMVLTKLLDAWTTLKFMQHPHQEQNIFFEN